MADKIGSICFLFFPPQSLFYLEYGILSNMGIELSDNNCVDPTISDQSKSDLPYPPGSRLER
jgi:hypothetical protein